MIREAFKARLCSYEILFLGPQLSRGTLLFQVVLSVSHFVFSM